MNLDELQTVRDTERRKDSLQHLRDSFYADVADYIAELREQRDRVADASDDPFADPEVQRLSNEIKTAENTVESVYERRVGKLVELASFAAADMPADEKGLTNEERTLFSSLVDRIEENRAHVLDVLADEVPDEDADTTATETRPATDQADEPVETSDDSTAGSAIDAADPTDEGAADAVAEPATADVDRTTLRITRDVGEIVGVDDREYDLSADDVVVLPETNAGPLVQRDAAERLD